MVMKELELSTELDARICCVIDDDVKKQGTYIHGVKVVGGRDKILEYAERYAINEIIVAIPSASKVEQRKILAICQQVQGCGTEDSSGCVSVGQRRGQCLQASECGDRRSARKRFSIQITTEKIGRYVSDKVVLVTGGGGSIGSELCRQIAANGVRQLDHFRYL